MIFWLRVNYRDEHHLPCYHIVSDNKTREYYLSSIVTGLGIFQI